MRSQVLDCLRGVAVILVMFRHYPLSPTLMEIGLIICLRFLTWQFAHDYTFRTHLFATHLRLDSLLFGVLLAYFYHFSGQSFNLIINRNYKIISIIGLSLLSIVFIWPIDSYWMGTIGLTMLYVAFGAILSVVIVLEERIMKMKWTSKIVNVFGFIGFYSYSIYLFHTMVAAFLIPVIFILSPVSLGGEILFVLYFIFSVGVGVVMSKFIELPFLKFRDRFFKSNS